MPTELGQAAPNRADADDDLSGTGPQPQGQQDVEPPDERVTIAPLIYTSLICGVAAVAGHVLLYFSYAFGWTVGSQAVVWQPVIGSALTVVAVAAFGGFYVASRRARIAIASAFLLTFLVSMTFVVTIGGFAEATQAAGARDTFDDFRNIVAVIIGFYFGSEGAISVAKVIGVSLTQRGEAGGMRAKAQAIQRADRDLAPPRPRRS